jgi:3-hydroxyisobutyrate dehydrogenase-like beta-hydroxyacid dehydrogenase
MSTVDENTAKQIAEAVAEKGGRFLEVRTLQTNASTAL